MMEIEEISLKLEEIQELLKREKEKNKKILEKLNILKSIIDKIYEKEKQFNTLQEEVNNTYKVIYLFLKNSEQEKELNKIYEELNIKDSYCKMEEFKEQLEKKSKILDERHLEKYVDDTIIPFLNNRIEQLKSTNEKLEDLFNQSVINIKDKLEILKRLQKTLEKIMNSFKKDYIINFYNNITTKQITSIESRIPSSLKDLLKNEDNKIDGLYNQIINEIFSTKDQIRLFLIENKLLLEEEISTLEAIYEISNKEFEFNIITSKLIEKIKVSERELHDIFINLSKKGLLTLKIFTD